MSRTVFRGVRVFDPGSAIDAPGRTVVVEDGVIVSLSAPRDGTVGDLVIEGRGALLCPGLVDLCAHLCEPGHTNRETIASGVRAAAKGGYTTLLAMPTTKPAVDRLEVVDLILTRAKEAGPTRVLPVGTLSVGRDGEQLAEMAQLQHAGCVAFTDAGRVVENSQLFRYALLAASELDVPILSHSVDRHLALGGVMHEGVVSARLGLPGIPAAAEAIGVSRDLSIAAMTGGHLHISHVSVAEAIEHIRVAKRKKVRVTAEVGHLHLCLTHEAVLGYNTRAKLTPPLRTKEDVEACIAGVADGTIDAVTSDHVPQIDLEKDVEFDRAAPGAIGLETTLSVVLGLVRDRRLTLARAISVLTRGPATVIGRNDIGRLVEGGPADLVLIDLEARWHLTAENLEARSKNTPLLGQELMGRSILTMAQGQVTYRSGIEPEGSAS